MKLNESEFDAKVAIWWYTPYGEFWDFSCNVDDASEYNGYLQYSNIKNHLTLWKNAVVENEQDVVKQKSIYEKGYKSFERGRVIFDLRTREFEVICSEKLYNDIKFREKCIEHFNLRGCRYCFIKSNHYYVAELTGNSTLDNFNYEV